MCIRDSSTALLLNLNQLRILQFPQGVDGFLPPTVEQGDHLEMCIRDRTMRLKSALRRGVAAAVIAGIVVSSGFPAYAAPWNIADGDITVKAGDTEGKNKVKMCIRDRYCGGISGEVTT